jgi:hypothetical protein
MKRLVLAPQTDGASYVALATYIVSQHVDFPGSWIVQVAAAFFFLHIRFERYRQASEKKKKDYFWLGAGFFVFFAFAMLFLPLATLWSPDGDPRWLWLIEYVDLFYLIPAAICLIALDRRKEPNQLPETTRGE